MTLSEAIKAIKNHRGPIAVDAKLFYHDMTWVEAKKGPLLETLKSAHKEGLDSGEYTFDVYGDTGYFSADS